MPFASSETATLHYTTRGAGEEALLLLMGLGGHATEWGEPFLAPLAQKYRVICMDHRGIGQSQSAVREFTLDDLARDAWTVVDALGLPRVHVAGTSMGGMVAQLVAAEHPERVGKLILMSTHFGGRESVPPTPSAANLFVPVPGMTPGEAQRRNLQVLSAPGFAETRPEVVASLAALRDAAPTRGSVFKAQFTALAQSDRSQLVRNLTMPCLVLHGREDPLVPLVNGEKLAARIPGARLCVLEDCGHYPHIEKPAETTAALLEFLG